MRNQNGKPQNSIMIHLHAVVFWYRTNVKWGNRWQHWKNCFLMAPFCDF